VPFRRLNVLFFTRGVIIMQWRMLDVNSRDFIAFSPGTRYYSLSRSDVLFLVDVVGTAKVRVERLLGY
jgi:hypothetical protein